MIRRGFRSPGLRRVLRRVRDGFPLRPLGLALLAFGTLALRFYAFERLDLVFLVVGYGSLALVGLALTFVLIAAFWVLRATRVDAALVGDFETARPAPTGMRFPRLRLVPLVQVDWVCDAPKGLRLSPSADGERLEAFARGEVQRLRRRFVIQDPLGLTRLAFHREQRAELKIVPHLGRLHLRDALTSLAGGEDRPHPRGSLEGDRVELRRYAPGDPARFIHWKIFARSRRLMVRMPERSLVETRRTLAYLVAGDGDEASSAVARVAVERVLGSAREEWRFAADGSESTDRRDEALAAILRSRGEEGGVGLPAFLRGEETQGPASLVLFVPAKPGPWLERVLTVVRARSERTRIFIGVDGFTDAPSRWQRALLRQVGEATSSSRSELAAVVDAFGALGAAPVVFDRATGRALGGREIRAEKRAA